MKQLIIKMIVVITMIFAGVTGCFAQYHRYHRPYYGGYYYGPRVYTGTYYGGYYRVYPRTVVVERPVYTTTTRTTTTVKSEDNPELKFDGVTIERESTNRVHVKGGKQNVTLDTSKSNLHIVSTKKGSVTVKTSGDGNVHVTVQHGDKIVGTYTL